LLGFAHCDPRDNARQAQLQVLHWRVFTNQAGSSLQIAAVTAVGFNQIRPTLYQPIGFPERLRPG
jgi:hypothetical protein